RVAAGGQPPGERPPFSGARPGGLGAVPGGRGASATGPLPLDGQLANARWGPEAAKADPSLYRQADVKFILPDYFETLRTRLVQGRTFSEADNAAKDAKLIIIDDHLAARAFPNQSAVGKRVLARIR